MTAYTNVNCSERSARSSVSYHHLPSNGEGKHFSQSSEEMSDADSTNSTLRLGRGSPIGSSQLLCYFKKSGHILLILYASLNWSAINRKRVPPRLRMDWQVYKGYTDQPRAVSGLSMFREAERLSSSCRPA